VIELKLGKRQRRGPKRDVGHALCCAYIPQLPPDYLAAFAAIIHYLIVLKWLSYMYIKAQLVIASEMYLVFLSSEPSLYSKSHWVELILARLKG
jgi:hypothetical protein